MRFLVAYWVMKPQVFFFSDFFSILFSRKFLGHPPPPPPPPPPIQQPSWAALWVFAVVTHFTPDRMYAAPFVTFFLSSATPRVIPPWAVSLPSLRVRAFLPSNSSGLSLNGSGHSYECYLGFEGSSQRRGLGALHTPLVDPSRIFFSSNTPFHRFAHFEAFGQQTCPGEDPCGIRGSHPAFGFLL